MGYNDERRFPDFNYITGSRLNLPSKTVFSTYIVDFTRIRFNIKITLTTFYISHI